MAKKEKPTPTTELPGLPIDQFERAVEALVALRDSGKFLIFLARRWSVRMIGDLEAFRAELGRLSEHEISEDEARKALNEVHRYARLWASVFDQKAAVNVAMELNLRGKKIEPGLREEFRNQQQQKIARVAERLFTEALQQRRKRLETATVPCVEDIDVELVQMRRDDLHDRRTEEPFLRIRLRYSTPDAERDIPFWYFFAMEDEVARGSASSFEFECDESDIDLLILRLTAAKRLLFESQSESTSEAP